MRMVGKKTGLKRNFYAPSLGPTAASRRSQARMRRDRRQAWALHRLQPLASHVHSLPPPPGSLRPRMVEKSDPRRYRQAKKEQDSHRRLLLQHQPTGRHISPRRSQPAISPLVMLVVQPHRMEVSTQLR